MILEILQMQHLYHNGGIGGIAFATVRQNSLSSWFKYGVLAPTVLKIKTARPGYSFQLSGNCNHHCMSDDVTNFQALCVEASKISQTDAIDTD